MGLDRFGERKLAADWNGEFALVREAEDVFDAAAMDFVQRVHHRYGESAYLDRLPEQVHQVEPIGHAPGAAEQYQMAQRRQASQPLFKGGLAHRVQNQVDAAAAGDFQRLRAEVPGLVIDHMVRPEIAHQLDLVIAGYRADNHGAGRLGDLHGADTDAARRGMNDHALSGSGVMTRMQ